MKGKEKMAKQKFKIRYMSTRAGKNGVRYYWQPSSVLLKAGFKLTRLPDELPEAAARAMELNAAVDEWRGGIISGDQAIGRIHPESFTALMNAYKASTYWRRITDRTRKGYEQCFDVLKAKFGNEIVHFITRTRVLKFYEEEYPKHPAVANACMRVLRLTLQFGVNLGWLKSNPASRPGMIASEPRQSVWSKEEENAFIETALEMKLPSIAAAFILSAYLGQRQGDILRLTPAQFNGRTFRLRQSKTKVWIEVPAHRRVREILERITMQSDRTIICTDTKGEPYKPDYFRKLFRKVISTAAKRHPEINFDNLQFLDLRRTAVVRLGEVGATEAEISAVTGHKLETCRQILETYLPRNSLMAANAIRKLELAA